MYHLFYQYYPEDIVWGANNLLWIGRFRGKLPLMRFLLIVGNT
ncbi:MAG: hypothetical protein RIB64_21065 [Arenibacter algicola]